MKRLRGRQVDHRAWRWMHDVCLLCRGRGVDGGDYGNGVRLGRSRQFVGLARSRYLRCLALSQISHRKQRRR